MASKYDPLGRFLSADTAVPLTLNFAQVEQILGFELPESARTHRPWWASDATHVQAAAWLTAGLTATPDLAQRRVTFSN